MDQSIFRKKSLDKVNSPEDLDRFLRVTNPPLWFLLAAVILLLAGVVVWGVVAKVETDTDGLIVSDGQTAVCYVSEQDIDPVQPGTVVRVGDTVYHVTAVAEESEDAEDVLNDYCLKLGKFQKGENIYELSLDSEIKSGNYACQIVLESISPVSFLLTGTNGD